ncbi:MAG: hypothetical protein KGL39_43165 [Patescibacteria group bacterium]|nr:hypothetical protein [Patescibacteria group bacterium]
MPTFRKGKEAIQDAASRTGGKFVPDIRWADKETKYVQFLQPIEEVTTVLMHPFIRVGERDDGTDVIAQFISRKDPALDGMEGYDPIIDRFGVDPVQRCIALAVELEPQGNARKPSGFKVARREFTLKDGTKKDVPAVGLVVQSPHIFYKHLDAISDVQPIEECVFAIKRTGASTDTTYTFIQAGDPLELDKEVEEFLDEFDFDSYLEDLASESRVHKLIDPLPDEWVVNKYAQKKNKGGGGSSTSSRRTRVPAAEDPEEETAPQPARTRRFSELRAQLEKQKQAAEETGEESEG